MPKYLVSCEEVYITELLVEAPNEAEARKIANSVMDDVPENPPEPDYCYLTDSEDWTVEQKG